MGTVVKQVGELEQMLEAIRVETLGASTLTAAELRLLPLLATHLSMAEIGERLFVSKHTVKSQAISAYRKLGVSNRTEASRQAQLHGLLGPVWTAA